MANVIDYEIPTPEEMYWQRVYSDWYNRIGWLRHVTFGPVELSLPQGGKCPKAWRRK